jgi:cytochrome b
MLNPLTYSVMYSLYTLTFYTGLSEWLANQRELVSTAFQCNGVQRKDLQCHEIILIKIHLKEII